MEGFFLYFLTSIIFTDYIDFLITGLRKALNSEDRRYKEDDHNVNFYAHNLTKCLGTLALQDINRKKVHIINVLDVRSWLYLKYINIDQSLATYTMLNVI